ncbi:hypothetical protein P8C59_004313 [Phyllachora maydis]|uniref:Uncharacterized protein n=1 Tax=Phyllachora maydis TaxID=1825666 RepID=A0AAD9I352_9PEZI|nr:hypothetical protein P8C59_004313 [Phyllachora maydis]
MAGHFNRAPAASSHPLDESAAALREDRVRSLLLARETYGRHYASMRYPLNFGTEFKKYREDEMELRTEWTNCAGDIATIVWVSDEAFLCGTTEHSDAHNQQYNKPGNLVLGSASKGTLQAYPDHRIVRPIVEKGENATHAMQESQDPWLYTSVVSSDYDATYDRAYTAGFDCVAKVWRVQKSGSSMELLGEWEHDGVVNFVSASKHSSGMVATAADVPTSAIRVYHHQDDADVSSNSKTRIRTQIRIFVPDASSKQAFTPVKTLDCTAVDINELTIMPNSAKSAYVTAGCTDGNVYVWDSALHQDDPIHVLRHDQPIEEYRGDREREDTGVKFTAWGSSLDRFYTVSYGMFSPDRTKLVIGDASGRVFLLTINEIEHVPSPAASTHGLADIVRDPDTGIERARRYLQAQQLVIHRDPTIGAVQGPRYAETGLFWREAHLNDDPSLPLLALYANAQQDELEEYSESKAFRVKALKPLSKDPAAVRKHRDQHVRNTARDLDAAILAELRASGEYVDVEYDLDYDTDAATVEDEQEP